MQQCDKVIVMHEGKIAAIGPYSKSKGHLLFTRHTQAIKTVNSMWLTNNEIQHSLEQKRLKSYEKSFGETTDTKTRETSMLVLS
jgi:ABC-type multidrug transport system ATPase subunit